MIVKNAMQAYIQNDSNSLTVSNKTLPLLAGERVLARLETDLDERLHFMQGELVLTSERLCLRCKPGPWGRVWRWRILTMAAWAV